MTMTTYFTPTFSPVTGRTLLIAIPAMSLSGLVLAAFAHRVFQGGSLLPSARGVWLTLHLLSVIPALPLGAYILLLRKGGRPHKLLGRVWAFMMMTAALSSFGLHGMTGHLSWIHILSIVTIVSIPRAVIQVIRGNVAGHRRTMTLVYVGLIIAGAATFIPGRLFAGWLFG